MKIKAIIIVMASAAFASCGEKAPVAAPEEGMVNLEISVAQPQAYVTEPATRSIASSASALTEFSMCAIPDRDEQAAFYYGNGYDNITGSGYNPCKFVLRGANALAGNLGFYPHRGPVWLYAAYPKVDDLQNRLSDLDHIPFSVGDVVNARNNHDYMYMEPVFFDPEGMAPGTSSAKNAVFRHVMTAVTLQMTTTMVGTVMVDSIRLEAFDGDERARIFARRGTYSIRDGSVETTSLASRLSLIFDASLSKGTVSSLSFVFPAVEYHDGRKIKATIFTKCVNDNTLDWVGQVNAVEFLFDNIITDGTDPEGLKKGHRYVYKLIALDNFIKYSGYPEIEEWIFDDTQIKEIVI